MVTKGNGLFILLYLLISKMSLLKEQIKLIPRSN